MLIQKTQQWLGAGWTRRYFAFAGTKKYELAEADHCLACAMVSELMQEAVEPELD